MTNMKNIAKHILLINVILFFNMYQAVRLLVDFDSTEIFYALFRNLVILWIIEIFARYRMKVK